MRSHRTAGILPAIRNWRARRPRYGFLVLAMLAGPATSVFAGIPPEQVEFFEKRIRPVLAQDCYECHSSTGKKKAGLVLDHREGWKAGGTSGDVIVPGKAADSLLFQSIRHSDADLKMPKNGAKLEERVIRDFETWINMGAPDPRDKPPTPDELSKDTEWSAVLERRKGWWSFQPIQNPTVPPVKAADWSAHPVDRFLLAKMEAGGLQPAGDAAPRQILRRLNFALTGLPPTAEELDAFAAAYAQNAQTAVDAAADRLLESPRFGERWARHWMDWVRYAETHGSEGDPAIPYAWKYRDYLIRALNADIPYPQLVREHIAGDLLPQPRTFDNTNESALGIAHYRMVLHGYTPTDALDEQVTFIDNQIDTVSKAFLGVTVSCARCHNHKFDAISQADFYAFYGIMASGRPATIDINLPKRQQTNAEKLRALKGSLRGELSKAWLQALDGAANQLRTFQADKKTPPAPLAAWARLSAAPLEKWEAEWRRLQAEAKAEQQRLTELRTKDVAQRWDLRGADVNLWTRDGFGVAQGATAAGEFHVLPDGERVVGGIYPAGIYSHLLSSKHRGVLASPTFNCDGGRLFIRVRGGNKAKMRYVVRNYPRSGTIYNRTELISEADEWVHHGLEYWKGDTLHIEVSTEADQPVETGNTERSWFGITEIIYTKGTQHPEAPRTGCIAVLNPEAPAPKNADELLALYRKALQTSIEAWRDGKMNDDQAELLGAFVQRDWLPNKLAELQACAALLADYRRLEAEVPVPARAPGLLEGAAFDQPLFERGNHKQPGAIVPRRFLEAIDPRPYQPGPARSGRLNLAESMVATNNPLTSRAIVNRLWHYVFGKGIVVTPDNFGRLGEPPSHPELLDHLAVRFQNDGGSLKKLLRLLVTSRAFRQEHRPSKEAAAQDPQNKLLSHFTSRRLEAEAIRDSMLALSGKLDGAAGGVPVDGGSNRRSVYVRVVRNHLDPFLSAFDFPVPSAPRGSRDVTNVPAQSLAMLNGPLVKGWARDWAARIRNDKALADDGARVRRMFHDAFSRLPSETEVKESLTYLQSMSQAGEIVQSALTDVERAAGQVRAKIAAPAAEPQLSALKAELAQHDEQLKQLREQLKHTAAPDYPWWCLAQALFNAKEFIYVR